MFIRLTTKKDKNTNKIYNNYQLVESYRTPKGPRQRIILTVGSQLNLDKNDRKILANRIEEILSNQKTFIPYEPEIERLANEFAIKILEKNRENKQNFKDTSPSQEEEEEEACNTHVNLNSLKTYQARTIGAEYTLYETAKKLNLDKCLLSLGMKEQDCKLALALIIARAAFPGSERRTFHLLQNSSATEELLHLDSGSYSLKQLYEVSDKLLLHKEKIEEHLEAKEKELFQLEEAIILYDLTNTYFEGSMKKNPKAKHGRSKEKRSDCPLVTMGLVLDEQGFPKRSKFFSGNVGEPITLESIIRALSNKKKVQPIVVMDAGLATEKNLLWLKENDYAYLTVFRQKSKKLLEAEDAGEWKLIKKTSNNEVMAVWKKHEKTDERCLKCVSTARAQKDKSIQKGKQEKLEKELEKLREGLSKSRCLKESKLVEQKIGRLKEKYKRIARFYEIIVEHCEKTGNATNLFWKVDQEKIETDFKGSYYLRTSMQDITEEKLWHLYTMLTQVERAFEEMKSTLGLRPVYHHLEHRTDGHMWITLLAYHLTHSIRYQLQLDGNDLSWKSIRDIMRTQIRVSTKINQTNGQTCHIRTTTEAEPMHKKILHSLGLPFKALKKLVFAC